MPEESEIEHVPLLGVITIPDSGRPPVVTDPLTVLPTNTVKLLLVAKSE